MMHKSPLLIIDGDGDIRAALDELLSFEGFAVETCESPADAMGVLARGPHSLVITDVVVRGAADLAGLQALVEAARPTPVVVMTAWRLTPEEVLARGAAAFVAKPFSVESLLSLVSKHASTRELPEAEAKKIRAYFEALSQSDWKGLGALLSPNVAYHLPAGDKEFNSRLDGRDAVVGFAKQVFPQFPECRFQVEEFWALPYGAVARYTSTWRGPDGKPARTEGHVLFHFADGLIATIGVRMALENFLGKRVQTPRTDFARA